MKSSQSRSRPFASAAAAWGRCRTTQRAGLWDESSMAPSRSGLYATTRPVHMQVERVVAGVEHAAREPAVVRRAGVVEDAVPAPIPVQIFGGGRPEAGRIGERSGVGLLVHALHEVSGCSK